MRNLGDPGCLVLEGFTDPQFRPGQWRVESPLYFGGLTSFTRELAAASGTNYEILERLGVTQRTLQRVARGVGCFADAALEYRAAELELLCWLAATPQPFSRMG